MKILIDATKPQKAEDILLGLEKKIDRAEAIGLIDGQGSFTVLRIAAAVANAIGYVKKIPLYQFKTGDKVNWNKNPVKIVIPRYGKQPNIRNSS